MRKLIDRLRRKRKAPASTPTTGAFDRAWTQPGSFTVHVPHSDVPKSRRFDSPLVTFLTEPKADD